MDIQLGPAGIIMIKDVSDSLQSWSGDDVMQRANFAGQVMEVIQKSDDEDYLFELHYLGYKLVDIVGMENAKLLASEFAKKVLAELSEIID